jgi:hypothetical protein
MVGMLLGGVQGKSSPSSNVVEGEMLDTVEEAECREGEEETWFFGLPEQGLDWKI